MDKHLAILRVKICIVHVNYEALKSVDKSLELKLPQATNHYSSTFKKNERLLLKTIKHGFKLRQCVKECNINVTFCGYVARCQEP